MDDLKRLGVAEASQTQSGDGGSPSKFFGGRCNRSGFWKGMLLWAGTLVFIVNMFDKDPPDWLKWAILGGWGLVLLRLVVRRLHDLGFSGCLVLTPLVAFLFPPSWRGWIIGMAVIGISFEEGDKTANKYGPPPA